CSHCWLSVRNGREFVEVPLCSWANGCWVGELPEELAGLSFAEELVILRAHSTKCWVKLKARHDPRNWQRGASGNVCIHPHAVEKIAAKLPRPYKSNRDDIAVIIVTDDKAVTPEILETLKKSPLVVRRGVILKALNWLKKHNRLYEDVEIDEEALSEYPDD
ncbi:hypothetical protein CYLTODRAFT_328010, partial [Cylindrobasidium torrendii FP15055 ss-10]